MKKVYPNATDVILGISIFSLAIVVVLFAKNLKFDSAIALSAIMASMIIPFVTKNLELEKHQKQLLYEKKFNAYLKYFEICDNFWRISGQTVINIHLLNTSEFYSREEFEKQKNKVIELYREFSKIRDYLSMPGVGILIFVNKKIETKISQIVELDIDKTSIVNTQDELKDNIEKIKKYIQIISELTTLLKEDLGIEDK